MERLSDLRILVLEDEYFIASDMRHALFQAGAKVVGPAAGVDAAIKLFGSEQIDAAVLDINLEGAESYPIVDLLVARSVPFLFLTGYDEWAIPERYRTYPRLSKPAPVEMIVAALSRLFD